MMKGTGSVVLLAVVLGASCFAWAGNGETDAITVLEKRVAVKRLRVAELKIKVRRLQRRSRGEELPPALRAFAPFFDTNWPELTTHAQRDALQRADKARAERMCGRMLSTEGVVASVTPIRTGRAIQEYVVKARRAMGPWLHDFTFDVRTRSKAALDLKAGDVIRFSGRMDAVGVYRGRRYRVNQTALGVRVVRARVAKAEPKAAKEDVEREVGEVSDSLRITEQDVRGFQAELAKLRPGTAPNAGARIAALRENVAALDADIGLLKKQVKSLAGARDDEGITILDAVKKQNVAPLKKHRESFLVDADIALLKKHRQSLVAATDEEVTTLSVAQVIEFCEKQRRIAKDTALTDVQRDTKLRERNENSPIQKMLRVAGSVANVTGDGAPYVVWLSAPKVQVRASILPVHAEAAKKLSKGEAVVLVGRLRWVRIAVVEDGKEVVLLFGRPRGFRPPVVQGGKQARLWTMRIEDTKLSRPGSEPGKKAEGEGGKGDKPSGKD